jgi:hypothetical protein
MFDMFTMVLHVMCSKMNEFACDSKSGIFRKFEVTKKESMFFFVRLICDISLLSK